MMGGVGACAALREIVLCLPRLQGEKGDASVPTLLHTTPAPTWLVFYLADFVCQNSLDYILLAFPSAWSRSHRMSSTSSIPMESRIKSGVTPPANWSSSDNCWCVVLAG